MPAGNETLAEPNKKHKHRHGHGRGSRRPHNGPKSKERRQRNQHKNKLKRQKFGKGDKQCMRIIFRLKTVPKYYHSEELWIFIIV